MKKLIILLLLLATGVYAQQYELPTYSPSDEIVKHSAYTLKYNEQYEEADWVAYKLTGSMVHGNAKRPSEGFKPDPLVPTHSAESYDYSKSGYDRGHLCPAADFKYDQQLMNETFYMSNMTPQRHAFNAGIWEDLENHERKWAEEYGEIYIADGPVLKEGVDGYIGHKDKVGVPKRFFKVILDYKDKRMIAFVIPHSAPEGDISIYAMTVKEAEQITGFDFFASLPKDVQDKLETEVDPGKWGLKPGARKYNHNVETGRIPQAHEDQLNKPKSEKQTQAALLDDQNIVYVVLGVCAMVIIILGIVILVGLRMNRKK